MGSAGQPTVTCSGGGLAYEVGIRFEIDILHSSGGAVQIGEMSLGYDISIAADFTEEKVGRGDLTSHFSNIVAGLYFFVEQPRL